MDVMNSVVIEVESQLKLISSFNDWLDQLLDKNPDHEQLISAIKARVASYRELLEELDSTGLTTLDSTAKWAINVQINPETTKGNEVAITITGLGADDCFEIVAKNQQDADYITGDQYLSYVKKVLNGFSQAEKDILSMVKLLKDIETETAQLRNPPEETVQTHIRLLKEYNDMKDMGQQMIGLIAENRQVPIGSLYENEDYGVTADD